MKKKSVNYIDNEYNDNQVLKKRKKIKNQKRKRRRRLICCLFIVVLFVCFFQSDLSKIQTIEILGNNYVTSEDILKHISVKKHQSYTFFTKTATIKDEVEDMTFIKSADVSKSLFGDIVIRVKESEPITYTLIDNTLYVVDNVGEVKEDPHQVWLSFVQRCPQANGFDTETFQTFAKEYANVSSVVQNQISNIEFIGEPNDSTKCQLELDDGKIFYVRIEDMASQLSSTNYYLVMNQYPDYKYYDFLGKNVYVSN